MNKLIIIISCIFWSSLIFSQDISIKNMQNIESIQGISFSFENIGEEKISANSTLPFHLKTNSGAKRPFKVNLNRSSLEVGESITIEISNLLEEDERALCLAYSVRIGEGEAFCLEDTFWEEGNGLQLTENNITEVSYNSIENTLHVKFGGMNDNETLAVRLMNMQGQNVLNKDLQEPLRVTHLHATTEVIFQLPQELSSGVYLANVYTRSNKWLGSVKCYIQP